MKTIYEGTEIFSFYGINLFLVHLPPRASPEISFGDLFNRLVLNVFRGVSTFKLKEI